MKEFRLQILVAYVNEWLVGRLASLEKLAQYAAVMGTRKNQGHSNSKLLIGDQLQKSLRA